MVVQSNFLMVEVFHMCLPRGGGCGRVLYKPRGRLPLRIAEGGALEARDVSAKCFPSTLSCTNEAVIVMGM